MALVIFLRGVNVGGHRTFRPSVLADEMKDYGLINIGAAGTFVVVTSVTEKRLRSELRRRLPFETKVMICTGEELITAVADDPFAGQPSRPDIVPFVSVLAEIPKLLPPIPVIVPQKDGWLLKVLSVRHQFLFGIYRREMKAIRCFTQIDKVFGAPGTIRNWNTIQAVLKVLKTIPDEQSKAQKAARSGPDRSKRRAD
jgi:uncharacterized protein (DUF1697 family)